MPTTVHRPFEKELLVKLRNSLISLFALAALASACGGSGSANLKGRVSDDDGAQTQEVAAGITQLGGQGTLSSATEVRAYQVQADGSLSLQASAQVATDGSFALSVPDGATKLVVQAVNSSGAVVASGIAAGAGTSDQVAQMPPLTSESSLEAEVFLQMVKQGVSVDEANAIDLQQRITADIATRVRAQATADATAADQSVAGLASAIAAAQRTQLAAFARAGVQTSQKDLFQAELSGWQTLSADVNAATTTAAATEAYAKWYAALDAVYAQLGIDAKTENASEREASASFRVTVQAKVGGQSSASQLITDAAIRAAASLEARVASKAVSAILSAGTATQATIDSATTAAAKLHTDLANATNASAAVNAWAKFTTSISGSGDLSASVLGNFLSVDGTTQATIQAAVDASAHAAGQLDTTLNSAFNAALATSGQIDFDALASSVVNAYGDFDDAVQTQATLLTGFGTAATPAIDLLVVADGAFRVN
jgi:hypothetical protein